MTTQLWRAPGPIIETHCHLDYLKQLSIDDIVAKSSEQNIEKIITIAVSPENYDQVIEIANKIQNVYCTQGTHPHHANSFTVDAKNQLSSNLKKSTKIVAIGEIGLDYYYNKSPKDIQIKVFEEHLQLAIDHDLPVVIHTRDADDDTESILKNFAPKLKRKGVIHSFTSGIKLAEFAIKENFMIGFNGIITFKNAQNVRDVLAITPLTHILLETDSPFLTPMPHRGKENAPFYLPYVAKFLCEQKNTDIEIGLNQIYQNTINTFKFS
jgi:TatD DNase family protein